MVQAMEITEITYELPQYRLPHFVMLSVLSILKGMEFEPYDAQTRYAMGCYITEHLKRNWTMYFDPIVSYTDGLDANTSIVDISAVYTYTGQRQSMQLYLLHP
jgi:hypothetical protein